MSGLGLGLGLGLGAHRKVGGGGMLPETEAYLQRVLDPAQDGGAGVVPDIGLTNKIIKYMVDKALYPNMIMGIFALTGVRETGSLVNKLYDLSVNGNNVTQTTETLQPSYTASGFARYNQVVTASQADYMICPRNASLEPTSFTISVWIRLRDTPVSSIGGWGGGIVSKGNNGLRSNILIHDFLSNGKIASIISTSATYTLSTTTNTPSTWMHVAVSIGSGKQMIYINGVLDVSNNISGSIVWGTDIPLVIGNALTEYLGSRGFNGEIDGVMYFNKVLTGATVVGQASGEIKELFDATKTIYGVV